MSLPIWAKGPVIGAMKPTRSSSAGAAATPHMNARLDAARAVLICLASFMGSLPWLVALLSLCVEHDLFRKPGPTFRDHALVRYGCQVLDARVRFPPRPLSNERRDAHQAARQIEDRQNIHA